MTYKERIIKRCKELSEEKRNVIIASILDILHIQDTSSGETLKKIMCKKCGADSNIIRYGKDYAGKQRYYCKCCGTFFTDRSYSVISYCHCDSLQIRKIVECMFNGYSLQKSSETCGISVGTVSRVKNKILGELEEEQLERIIAKVKK